MAGFEISNKYITRWMILVPTTIFSMVSLDHGCSLINIDVLNDFYSTRNTVWPFRKCEKKQFSKNALSAGFETLRFVIITRMHIYYERMVIICSRFARYHLICTPTTNRRLLRFIREFKSLAPTVVQAYRTVSAENEVEHALQGWRCIYYIEPALQLGEETEILWYYCRVVGRFVHYIYPTRVW